MEGFKAENHKRATLNTTQKGTGFTRFSLRCLMGTTWRPLSQKPSKPTLNLVVVLQRFYIISLKVNCLIYKWIPPFSSLCAGLRALNKQIMRLLLTSAGISNASIHNALVQLLGKPVGECNAVFVPTAIYGIRNGGDIVRRVICGELGDPFCNMGWKQLGLLELSALPGIKRELWVEMLQQTDALLVGGGDCQYLTYWMQQSGLAAMLPQLLRKTVYVGLSAGSMIMTSYGTTYGNHTLPPETDKCLGLLNFALHPHLDYPTFPNNSMAGLEKLAATLPMPSYLVDDQTAIKVVDGVVEVVSEGKWKLVRPGE